MQEWKILQYTSEEVLKINTLQVGTLGANCYILEENGLSAVVDPGGSSDVIIEALGNTTLKYIFLTHAHFDHISGLDDIKNRFPEAEIVIHAEEKFWLSDMELNLSTMTGEPFSSKYRADIFVEDGDEIEFAGKKCKVFHTPGHTPGSCSFLIDSNLFSGDTLFESSIGRTDFPGGDSMKIRKSIKDKIFTLPDETTVYPGHMASTTVGREKKFNPFF